MKDSGLLIVISGFSGSGKGTIMKELLGKYPDEYALSVSATTRAPREGEVDGREYFFKSRDQFLEMIQENALLEYAQYVDHYYGTPRSYVQEQLSKRRHVILEIEIQGALKIKEQFPDALLLFVTPPSAQILRDRLTGRGTEEADVIHSRLARAVEEADGCEAYDYLIVNDVLEDSVEEVHRIIRSECSRMNRNLDTIETIKYELKEFLKGDIK